MDNFFGVARSVKELKEMLNQLPEDATIQIKHIFVETDVEITYSKETNTVTLR